MEQTQQTPGPGTQWAIWWPIRIPVRQLIIWSLSSVASVYNLLANSKPAILPKIAQVPLHRFQNFITSWDQEQGFCTPTSLPAVVFTLRYFTFTSLSPPLDQGASLSQNTAKTGLQ